MINICTSTYQRRRIFLRTSQLLAAFISLPMAALYEQGVVHTVLSSVYSIDYCISQKRKVQNDSFTLKLNFRKEKVKVEIIRMMSFSPLFQFLNQ